MTASRATLTAPSCGKHLLPDRDVEFEKAYNAEGAANRELCELFGPEKIPENLVCVAE
jgi:hypothetical protein